MNTCTVSLSDKRENKQVDISNAVCRSGKRWSRYDIEREIFEALHEDTLKKENVPNTDSYIPRVHAAAGSSVQSHKL